MAFVLRGEIDIDGRKGIAVLRQVQGEATKTTKAFEQGSHTNAKFAKMLLGINSQAAATHKALFLLARTGGAGLFGVGLVKAGIDFGETLMNIGQEAESAGKSLDKTFRAGLKATTTEGVQSSIESITNQIDNLQKKTEGFSLRRMLGKGLERLTGIDFGLTPEEGLIAAGEKELEVLKKRLEARKNLEAILKIQEDSTKKEEIQRAKNEAQTNLEIAQAGEKAKTLRLLASEQMRSANLDLQNQEKTLEMLKGQKAALEIITGLDRDEPAIKKIGLEIEKQKVQVLKAQANAISAIRKEEGQVLGGSRAGRTALQSAQKRKGRQDIQEAFQRENFAVANRQMLENEKRRAEGKPPLSQGDIRNIMAEEAVGLREIKAPTTLPSAITEGPEKTGGFKAEIKPVPMAQTMESLLKEFQNLASVLKSAPLVTSGAGTV